MTLADVIPLFPLPNIVFFPRMPLPLHVFEPRYRQMVRDADRGARLIGMVLLRGDWQRDYYGRPPIFGIGTVGELAHVEELPDGRFNVALRGLREFVVQRELERAPYREAVVSWREPLRDHLAPGAREAVVGLVLRYLERQGRELTGNFFDERAIDEELIVNFLAQHLDLPVLEKQALLEAATLSDRAQRLRDVLEFRLEELRVHPGGTPGRAH